MSASTGFADEPNRQITTSNAEIMAACPQLSTIELMEVEFPRSNADLNALKLSLKGKIDDSDDFTVSIGDFTQSFTNPPSPNEIYLIDIQSIGGDIRVTHPLIDAMRESEQTIVTYASFQAESAAFSLLISGTPDFRWVLEGASLMSHPVMFTHTNGNEYVAEDFAAGTDNRRLMDAYNQYIKDLMVGSSVTNMPEGCASSLVQPNTDVRLSNEAALQLGLIDYVVDWSTETALTRAPN